MDTSFTRWVPPSLWQAVHTDPHPLASVLKTNRRPTVPTGITARTSCTMSSVLVRAVVLHSLMGGGPRPSHPLLLTVYSPSNYQTPFPTPSTPPAPCEMTF